MVVDSDEGWLAERKRERASGLLCFVEREEKNETTTKSENEDLNFCNVSLVFSTFALLFFL